MREINGYYEPNIKTSRNEDSVYAMKYASQQMLINKLQQENRQLNEEYTKVQKMYEDTFRDYQQLKDNWNKLKKYMIDTEQIYKKSDDKYIKDMHEIGIRHAYQTILYKMHVLEQGSDSDGQ